MQVLGLADNSITTVEGLENLLKLRDLSLARNDISHIGDALSKNTALQNLNLADNPIGSFKVSNQSCQKAPHMFMPFFTILLHGISPHVIDSGYDGTASEFT